MRSFVAAGAVLAASINGALALTSQQLCDVTKTKGDPSLNNWYCSAVNAIAYQNVGTPGSYKAVTSMSNSAAQCSQAETPYKGAMGTMAEDWAIHVRGPIKFTKMAVYMPSKTTKREVNTGAHQRRHGHQQFHEHNKEVREVQERELEERADWTVMTMDGKVVSWRNNGAGAAATAAPTPLAKIGGNWKRTGFYDAEKGTLDGLTFLNHNGGSGSGVFDYVHGNSLSYASADGLSGAASPQVLKNTLIPSNKEFAIFSDVKCDADCGFVRPGTVAYKGFGGPSKAFVFQFQMPHEPSATGLNPDMSAIWMLNAKIPRTLQYGEATCSCWDTGCGEFDIFEILEKGSTKCKSTFHGNTPGGDSNYFRRPANAPITAAVIFNGDASSAQIQILDASSGFNWDTAITSDMISKMTTNDPNKISLFSL
ncbi:MAG: target of Sbf [Vezdaea aestivalis]|nr:MAG: target of Sbf [Vezdaea aestivalis]